MKTRIVLGMTGHGNEGRIVAKLLKDAGYSVKSQQLLDIPTLIVLSRECDIIILLADQSSEHLSSIVTILRRDFIKGIFVISNSKEVEHVRSALNAGADDYLLYSQKSRSSFNGLNLLLQESGTKLPSAVTEHSLKNLSSFVEFAPALLKELSGIQRQLLTLLMNNKNRILTWEFVLMSLRGPGFISQWQYLSPAVTDLQRIIHDWCRSKAALSIEPNVGIRLRIYS